MHRAIPVLFLSNPPGIDAATRRRMLDRLTRFNERTLDLVGDPETQARIDQAEMAFRMQSSVPELTDISNEPQNVLDMYGPDVNKPGTFAASCLLARRMAQQGVRFTQIFHRGWDQHLNIAKDLVEPVSRCRSTMLGVDPGLEAERSAGRHAGRVGRRVRPHRLLPRQVDA